MSTVKTEWLDALLQRMINRGLEAEMDAHLVNR